MARTCCSVLLASLLASGLAAAEQLTVEIDSLAVDSIALEDSLGNSLGTAWAMLAVVTVRGSNNEGVTNLPGESFTAEVDETPCDSVKAEPSQDGVAIILCLDTSRSQTAMAFEVLKQAVSDCIDSLRTQDRMAIYSFSDQVSLVADFSSNKAFLKGAVTGLSLSGNRTMLWQAVHTALGYLDTNQPEETPTGALVVFSDGLDDPPGGSGAYTADQCVEYANELVVPIMTIGFASADQSGLQYLQNISDRTDGQYTPPGSPENFSEQFGSTLQSLKCVYIVTIAPALYDSGEHRVVIEVNDGPLSGSSDEVARVFGSGMEPDKEEDDSEAGSSNLLMVLGGVVVAGAALIFFSRRKAASRRQRALREALARSEAKRPSPQRQAQPEKPLEQTRAPSHRDPSEPEPTSIDAPAGKRPSCQEERGKTVFMPAGTQYSSALLQILEGPEPGKEYPLGCAEVTIGSSEDNIITIQDTAISRKHAVIRCAAGLFELEDRNSTNGTYANDMRVQRAVLTDGDVIRLGRCKLIFRGAK
jgi:hypothetical protein